MTLSTEAADVAVVDDAPVSSSPLPLLELKAFTLKRGPNAVLDDVTLTLVAGRTLGLLGESGAGKSTLAMAIIGLLQPPEVGLAGSMKFAGQEVVGLRDVQFRKLRGNRIGLVF